MTRWLCWLDTDPGCVLQLEAPDWDSARDAAAQLLGRDVRDVELVVVQARGSRAA